MNSTEPRPEPISSEEREAPEPPNAESNRSMEEYSQLQQGLLLWTLAVAAIFFISVWISYGLATALNYLLGACVGVIYLKMLARDVERIGSAAQSPLQGRLALFIGLVIVATQIERLQLVPIVLGFMTYKATLFGYMLVTVFMPKSS